MTCAETRAGSFPVAAHDFEEIASAVRAVRARGLETVSTSRKGRLPAARAGDAACGLAPGPGRRAWLRAVCVACRSTGFSVEGLPHHHLGPGRASGPSGATGHPRQPDAQRPTNTGKQVAGSKHHARLRNRRRAQVPQRRRRRLHVAVPQDRAFRGGVSKLASGGALFNAILARRPDLARVLQEPFPFRRARAQSPFDAKVQVLPVFQRTCGGA